MRVRRTTEETHLSSVVRFALTGLAALVLVAIGTGLLLRRSATSVAIDDARRLTRVIARVIVQPGLDDSLLSGDKTAFERLDSIVHSRVITASDIVKVNVWATAGLIVYSSDSRLAGKTLPLPSKTAKAFRTGSVVADVSTPDDEDRLYDRGAGKLLEVYLPVRTPGGRLLLFETYQPYREIDSGGRRLWLAVAPLALGALLLLELTQLPVAWSMARRLREGQRERELLYRRSIEASDAERARIARDLHDGVVQDLAGVAFGLAAAEGALPENASADTRHSIADAAATTRRSMRRLRTMMVDIYPPNLREEGLAAAMHDLVSPLDARGIHCEMEVPETDGLGPETQAILFRVAQEALRNVIAHSEANEVRIAFGNGAEHASVEIADNGKGFDDAEVTGAAEHGHVGLRMLRDAVAHAGGRLEISSSPGAGTTVRATVPTE